ncbi:MFS domain-containing protein [Mycena venus]|uniref:MFS domain-containing protein n=1 Tax=Mycena venus TaxID=2733690 RepID=A0A8H6X2Q0_9AGAR|nr:MFS domain-containing protein [Mycena venus]
MSSPSPAAPAPPSPDDVLGPFYIGVVLNTFLYGILVLQSITYYQGFKRDRRWLRLFILYIFIAETVNTAVSVAMIYEPLISQFGTGKPMFLFPTYCFQYSPGQPIMETAVSVPVQFFYAWRIRIILQNWFAPALICLTSLAALGGAWWTSFVVQNAVDYLHKSEIDHPALVWSVSSAACDVLITMCLFFSLRGRKTGIKHTDDAVNRIVRTTVQTGALTMIFTGLNVGLFVGLPNSTLSFVFDFALPKLYSNALISTLNARGGAMSAEQPQRNVLFSTHAQTSSQHIVAPTSVVINKTYNTQTDYIEMHRQVEVHRDADNILSLDHPYREPK